MTPVLNLPSLIRQEAGPNNAKYVPNPKVIKILNSFGVQINLIKPRVTLANTLVLVPQVVLGALVRGKLELANLNLKITSYLRGGRWRIGQQG